MSDKLTPLELARLARQKQRENGEDVTIERLTPIEKAKRNPNSRKLAVDAKCYECQGFNADPAVKWRIGNCQMDDCPLHNVRPYQKMAGRPMPSGLAKAIGITDEDGIVVAEHDDDNDDGLC